MKTSYNGAAISGTYPNPNFVLECTRRPYLAPRLLPCP